MPIDPFNLPDLADAPLDMPSLPGGLPNPQAASQPPKDKSGGMGEIARMLPMLAAAMKSGGRMGVAGFLQGIQRARAAKEQQARQGQQDTRQSQVDQSNQDYRQQQLMLQAEQQRQAEQGRKLSFMQQFGTALNNVDDPKAIDALMTMYGPQADMLGIGRAQLEQYAASVAPPTTLQKRAAEKRIAKLRTDYGTTWMEEGAKFMHDLPGGERVSFQELLRRGGMTPDPNAPPAPSTDKRGFATKDVTVNGKRMLAGYDPDTNSYYAPGDTHTALTGDIQEYQKPAPASAEGLSPRQQTQVTAQARTYESLPVVKNTQVMSEAVNFTKSLDPNTKNPADDQALIYAFAKAMDPNSVVREGEYATVQKYAQSWAESFGFNAARIFSNTAFLTPAARQNMKRTIQQRFRAAQGQYKVVHDSYVQKINKITGMADGADWLTDYGAAFPADEPSQPPPAGRATVTPPTTQAPPARQGGAGPVANPFRR